MFAYAIETERRFYLANEVDVRVQGDGAETPDRGRADATPGSGTCTARPGSSLSVRVLTFKDVNVEELPKREV